MKTDIFHKRNGTMKDWKLPEANALNTNPDAVSLSASAPFITDDHWMQFKLSITKQRDGLLKKFQMGLGGKDDCIPKERIWLTAEHATHFSEPLKYCPRLCVAAELHSPQRRCLLFTDCKHDHCFNEGSLHAVTFPCHGFGTFPFWWFVFRLTCYAPLPNETPSFFINISGIGFVLLFMLFSSFLLWPFGWVLQQHAPPGYIAVAQMMQLRGELWKTKSSSSSRCVCCGSRDPAEALTFKFTLTTGFTFHNYFRPTYLQYLCSILNCVRRTIWDYNSIKRILLIKV